MSPPTIKIVEATARWSAAMARGTAEEGVRPRQFRGRLQYNASLYQRLAVSQSSSTRPEAILDELRSRELIAQQTGKDELRAHLSAPRVLYCGFDPTADSLHVGSLLPLLTMLRFMCQGHRALLVLGGATGLVGDPSFKEHERGLQSGAEVAARGRAIAAQCQTICGNYLRMRARSDGAEPAGELEVLDNLSWLGELRLLDFLRDIGKHFSVNMMVRREAVQQRLAREDRGISYTEFSYLLLQAADFAQLYRRCGCTLQIGGSDQWGNITGGIELIRRLRAAQEDFGPPGDHGADGQAFGLTLPLVTREDGGKFGKTEAGTVWLAPQRTSPFAFHQFWINTSDQDLPRYRKYFSLAPPEPEEVETALSASQLIAAKRALADELTELVHGEEGLAAATRITDALFSGDPQRLTEADLQQLTESGMDCTRIDTEQLSLAEALVSAGLAVTPRGQVTMGQARKFLREGAIRVDGHPVTDADATLRRDDALFGRFHLVRRGKKQFHLFFWS